MSINNKTKSKKDLIEENLEIDLIFDIYGEKDKDGEIKISKGKLKNILKDLNEIYSVEKINSSLKEAEPVNKEKLTKDEFEIFLENYRLLNNNFDSEEVINAFKAFDRNNNGFLTMVEFKHILGNLGQMFPKEKIELFLKDTNLNMEDKIDYNQFVEFWEEH